MCVSSFRLSVDETSTRENGLRKLTELSLRCYLSDNATIGKVPYTELSSRAQTWLALRSTDISQRVLSFGKDYPCYGLRVYLQDLPCVLYHHVLCRG